MTKKIHFETKLIPLILSGQKTATWRIDDDKDLKEGDFLELLESGTEKFIGKAKILKIIEKPFKDLTPEDKIGHKTYQSEEEMFKTFTSYYEIDMNKNSTVKIAKYKLSK